MAKNREILIEVLNEGQGFNDYKQRVKERRLRLRPNHSLNGMGRFVRFWSILDSVTLRVCRVQRGHGVV